MSFLLIKLLQMQRWASVPVWHLSVRHPFLVLYPAYPVYWNEFPNTGSQARAGENVFLRFNAVAFFFNLISTFHWKKVRHECETCKLEKKYINIYMYYYYHYYFNFTQDCPSVWELEAQQNCGFGPLPMLLCSNEVKLVQLVLGWFRKYC